VWQTVVTRLVVSMFLGALIGFERESHRKPAGLRTHMLVSLGCTLFMLLAVNAVRIFETETSIDPSRIAAQIITGVGFLGAGTIIRGFGSVHGLTTAASIWLVAAVGTAVGAGFYSGAVSGTAAALLVLWIGELRFLSRGRREFLDVTVEHEDTPEAGHRLDQLTREFASGLQSVNRSAGGGVARVIMRFRLDRLDRKRLLQRLSEGKAFSSFTVEVE